MNYNSKTAKTNYTTSGLTFPSQNPALDNSSRFFLVGGFVIVAHSVPRLDFPITAFLPENALN